jgi:hypothetical protein
MIQNSDANWTYQSPSSAMGAPRARGRRGILEWSAQPPGMPETTALGRLYDYYYTTRHLPLAIAGRQSRRRWLRFGLELRNRRPRRGREGNGRGRGEGSDTYSAIQLPTAMEGASGHPATGFEALSKSLLTLASSQIPR